MDLLEVAPSFEAFVYRWWVENLAWFELQGGKDHLSAAVRSYLTGLPTAAPD